VLNDCIQDFVMTLSSLSSGILVLMHEQQACSQLAAALVPSSHNRSANPDSPQTILASHLQSIADASVSMDMALKAAPGSKQAMRAMQAMLHLARSRLSCQVGISSALLFM
jgi:hypothetical protein